MARKTDDGDSPRDIKTTVHFSPEVMLMFKRLKDNLGLSRTSAIEYALRKLCKAEGIEVPIGSTETPETDA